MVVWEPGNGVLAEAWLDVLFWRMDLPLMIEDGQPRSGRAGMSTWVSLVSNVFETELPWICSLLTILEGVTGFRESLRIYPPRA